MNTIDKAIRACDAGTFILFYKDIDGKKVSESFSDKGRMQSRRRELEQHGITKFKEWEHAEWAGNDYTKIFNQIKSSL